MSVTIQKELREKLEKFSNLPSVPQVINKIQQISGNPKSSVADLSNCILSDHQLTSRILRMANSSYYGDYAGKVNTVTHAIVLMGFRAVRNIAVSMSIYGMVNKLSRSGKFDITAFWTRSLACGLIAKYLSHRINQHELAEAAFVAGFLHDIGQIMLAGVFPDEYARISKMESESLEVYKTERVMMGIDHLEVGAYVAHKWNLPPALVSAIAEHHRVDLPPGNKSTEQLVDLVFIADRVYAHLMSGTAPESEAYATVKNQARALLGVNDKAMTELLAVIREEMADVAADLEIDIEREFEKRAVADDGPTDVHQRLAHKEVQLSFLQNGTVSLMQAESEDEILQVLCETVYRGLQMGRVIVFEYDSENDSFAGCVGFGLESQDKVQAMKFSAKVGLFKELRATEDPIMVVGENKEIYGSLITDEQIDSLEAQAFVAVPIRILDDTRYAVFADAPNRQNPIADDTQRSLVSLAGQAGMVLERHILRARLKR